MQWGQKSVLYPPKCEKLQNRRLFAYGENISVQRFSLPPGGIRKLIFRYILTETVRDRPMVATER